MHVERAVVDRLVLDALRAHQLVHDPLAVLAETELDERVAARALGRALAQEAQAPRVEPRVGGEPDADRRLRAAQRLPEHAMRAHVPEPQGAASTWPGPHTSALGDTPWSSGSSWTRTLSTVVLPTPGTSTRSWAFTASRTAIPHWAIRLTCSRRTATPTCSACTTAKTLPTPTAMSSGTSPTPSTSTT